MEASYLLEHTNKPPEKIHSLRVRESFEVLIARSLPRSRIAKYIRCSLNVISNYIRLISPNAGWGELSHIIVGILAISVGLILYKDGGQWLIDIMVGLLVVTLCIGISVVSDFRVILIVGCIVITVRVIYVKGWCQASYIMLFYSVFFTLLQCLDRYLYGYRLLRHDEEKRRKKAEA